MGADIHIYVEVYKKDKWIHVDKKILYCKYNIEYPEVQEEYIEEFNTSPVYEVDHIYAGRNYILFGYLGNVRGSGPPIVQPRGMPDDLSDGIQEIVDFRYEHSGSYLTLKELKRFKWDKLKDQEDSLNLRHFFTSSGKWSRFSAVTKLERIRKKHKAEDKDVRIVFWFDS